MYLGFAMKPLSSFSLNFMRLARKRSCGCFLFYITQSNEVKTYLLTYMFDHVLDFEFFEGFRDFAWSRVLHTVLLCESAAL